jgi:Na+/melibiose symporter-like transporter
MSGTRLTFSQRLSYAAPVAPLMMLMQPALSVVPALYARYAGLNLVVLGGMLFATRMFDGLIDPVLGHLSDRTRTPLGARKPWIIAGAILCAVSCYFWFRPGEGTGALYFMTWSIVISLGWSMMETAHAAWLADITEDYDERSVLAGLRSGALYVGFVTFFAIPLLPIFETTAFTPDSLAVIGWVAIGALAMTTALAVVVAPAGKLHEQAQPQIWQTVKSLSRNKPLRIYIVATTLACVSTGMVGALYFFFMSNYLDIADKVAQVALGTSILGFLASLVWPIIMSRIGKHATIAVGAVATAATLIAMSLIRPGAFAYPAMLVVFGLSSLVSASQYVAMYAIMADIADYDELRTRQSSAAVFYSVNTVIEKFGIAVGGSVALVLVGLFDFDPTTTANSATAMRGFFVVFIWIPLGLNLLSALFAWRFPITRRRYDIIRRRLEQRRLREARSV